MLWLRIKQKDVLTNTACAEKDQTHIDQTERTLENVETALELATK